MDVGRTLRDARKAAGLSQRQLALRAGVPQSTVARIERGRLMPRVDTFDRLVRAAELQVALAPVPGAGVDRSLIRARLHLTPAERLRLAVADANNVTQMLARVRRVSP